MAQKELHPEYYQAKVLCTSCNFAFITGSTVKELKVDSCSNCHPFYTGGQRAHGADSRVERFKQKYQIK